jgi:hypothetical protein
MSVEASHVLRAIALGIGATLGMDLWNLFLKRAFGIPSLDYCLLGRWLRHMPGGVFRHASIAAAPQKPLECAVGCEEALFAGTSSGANVAAAMQVAQRLGPGATVVTLMADSGLKYLSTDVYRSG